MHREKFQTNIASVLAVLLVLLMMVSAIPTVQAAEASGSCGSNASWVLSGGVLTISGSGAMADYTETAPAPWHIYRNTIYTVVVSDGITGIGEFAFLGLETLTAAQLADTVERIGSYAFYGCEAMEVVDMSDGITEIGRSAFERCRSLRAITLPGTLRIIRSSAFYRCESLLSVTVPASVNIMEHKVFTYCSGLRSAAIRANIGELPYWTFYGCYALSTVSLSSSITSIGVSAFENCDQLTSASYGGNGESADSVQQQIQTEVPGLESFKPEQDLGREPSKDVSTSTTQTEDGTTVTVDKNLHSGQNSVVETQIVQSGGSTTVKIEAVLENESGWDDVDKQLSNALTAAPDAKEPQLDIYLKDSTVSGGNIARFAGREVKVTLHAQQGAVWHINGQDLSGFQLKETYDLSYTLKPVSELTKAQAAVIGMGRAYILIFHDDIDFNVELELPVGQPRNVASFLSPEKNDTYSLMQRVVIDAKGMAHFYLGSVRKNVEYLIGINIPTLGNTSASENNVIIPENMHNEYPPVEYIDKAQYLVTDVKSSWGLSFGQVTLILVGVLVSAVLVVGVVMRIYAKKKYKTYASNLKNGRHGDSAGE